MRDREYDVAMSRVDQTLFLLFQPATRLEKVTLRAAAMPAGVVPHALDMAVGAGLDVATQLGCAAGDNGVSGFVLMAWQATG